MKLKDLFQNLALGELSSSSLVEIGQFEIDRKQLPKVIQATNQALEYFYSNFPLKIGEVTVRLSEGISRYYLDYDYATSNPEAIIKYIMDTHDKPFNDDVLHILQVRSMNGYSYPLNDLNVTAAIHTPEYNCIQVTDSIQDKFLVVTYQAGHKRIPLTEQFNSNFAIQIPSSYRTALQTYVACLLLQNMGGNHLNESNALFAKFKTLTEELKLQGIGTVVQTGINIKPVLRGWV